MSSVLRNVALPKSCGTWKTRLNTDETTLKDSFCTEGCLHPKSSLHLSQGMKSACFALVRQKIQGPYATVINILLVLGILIAVCIIEMTCDCLIETLLAAWNTKRSVYKIFQVLDTIFGCLFLHRGFVRWRGFTSSLNIPGSLVHAAWLQDRWPQLVSGPSPSKPASVRFLSIWVWVFDQGIMFFVLVATLWTRTS